MRLAFFGGTFNPPHNGHKLIINYCLRNFDKFIVIPNKVSPDKKNISTVSYKHRINMLKLLLMDDNVIIDPFEIESKKKNYTSYTVRYLLKKYKGSSISMIIGEDQLYNLHNWYDNEFILSNINIICFTRKLDDKNQSKDQYNVKKIDFDFPFSSSYIRELIFNNKKIKKSVIPTEISDYINENKLYK